MGLPDAPEQKWFEMVDIIERTLDSATWIPLRNDIRSTQSELFQIGAVEEYLGVVTALVDPIDYPSDRNCWDTVSGPMHGPWIEDGTYNETGTIHVPWATTPGRHPILVQDGYRGEPSEWYLHQDLIFALDLRREGDVWVRPREDYVEVVRLSRDKNGKACGASIRQEHLRDYLCARGLALLLATYRSRRMVLQEKPQLDWNGESDTWSDDLRRWQGSCHSINAVGMPAGSTIAVLRVGRESPALDDEVPFASTDDPPNVHSRHDYDPAPNTERVLVSGELWRQDWVRPAQTSPRVRRDRVQSSTPFIIDASGTRMSGPELGADLRWLWFSPRVILEILARRGSRLAWYTHDTGEIGLPSHLGLHFGINTLGLINVFAGDIADLPHHVQRIWAAYNETPEGGVSNELMASQAMAAPAATVAPEVLFREALNSVEQAFSTAYGENIFRHRESDNELYVQIHRFRCATPHGTLALCKDITRLVTERIEMDVLKKLDAGAPKDFQSLKRLERLVTQWGEDGRSVLGPLVAVNDLRIADAHHKEPDFDHAFQLLGVVNDGNHVLQGATILMSVANSLNCISEAVLSGIKVEVT